VAATPEQLGKYKIVRVIGKGAMGVVYEGFDTVIERTVAIKTIRTDELDPAEAEEHSRRFLIEAKAAGKINHPNIVGIYDYGNEQSLAYIVMEYVQGKELKAYFDAGHRFTIEQVLRIMGQLLGALELAHANGVVHRDIKPANIFLTENGTVKLGDFGIARIDSTHKTHAGTILGTPSYMSPEQIKGETVDQRSDLYSTGVILYQFLTGEKPFTGSMVAVMHKVLNEEPPPPSSLNPAISPAFDLVVAKAMAKDLSARFTDAKQFAISLRGTGRAVADEESEQTRVINLKDLDLTQGHTAPADATSRTGVTQRTSTSIQRDSTLADNEIEIEFWRSIKDSTDSADFEVYLRKYPQGHYAELAQLKLDKLRRADSTLTARADTTATHTGATGIGEMRRKAEEARRKAEEEYQRAEEELKRAEEAQRKAQEEANGKAEAAVAEALDAQRIADELSRETGSAIESATVPDAVKGIKPRAESALQAAGQIQSRLRDLLAARELLQTETLGRAENALARTETIQQTLRETLSRLESALKQLIEASQRKAEAAIAAVHDATQALREAEQLSQQAIQAGTTVASADMIHQSADKASGLAAGAKGKLQAALVEKHLLVAEVLAKLQSSAAANEQLFQKVELVSRNFDEARSKAEEEARYKAEEEARRKAEEEAKRKAEEDAKRMAAEEARRKAEEDARRKAEEEARRKAEEEARRKAEEEAGRKAEEAARVKAEEDAKRKAAEETSQQLEEEAKRKAEQEAGRKAEEDVRRKAEVEAKRKTEEAASLKAAEEAKRKAETDAKRKAEEEAKRKSEEAAGRKAADEAKRKAEEDAGRKVAAEAKRKADEEARRKVDSTVAVKRQAEQAEADATMVATATRQNDADATQYIATAKPVRETVPVSPAPARAEPKAKNAVLLPAIAGGVVVLAVVGWLVLKPGGERPAPQEPAAPKVTTPAPSALPESDRATASQQQADQAKAASQAAEQARQQADQLAKSKADEASKALEAAKQLTDETARKKALEAARQAEEEAKKAAETARRRGTEEAEKKIAADKARQEEAKRAAADKSKQEEEKRIAADKARQEEAKRVASEKTKQEDEKRIAAEKARQEEGKKGTGQEAARTQASPSALFQLGQGLEQTNMRDAVKRYQEAGNAGYGPASRRLMEIYLSGAGNVGRDYGQSIRWKAKAVEQGVDVGSAGR